jgi:hypothetical protein
VSTPDQALRQLLNDMGPYEGLLASIVGVEDREGRPGRRRVVALATDQRVLIARVRDAARPERLPYAQVMAAEVHHDEHGTHVDVSTRSGEQWRICRVRDATSAGIFTSLVNDRAGTPARPATRSSRVRILAAND